MQSNSYFNHITLLVVSAARIMPSINTLLINYNSIKFNDKPSAIIYQKIKEFEKMKNLDHRKNILSISFKDHIRIRNLNYKIKDNEILKNLNITINKNDKIALVGKVGSGKTTTLQILSGLTSFHKGEIKLDNKIVLKPNQRFVWNKSAYFKQNAALINDTIKNNIFFLNEKEFDENNYNYLIKSFGLKENFFKNNNHMSKKIGFLGSKISGGQKQITALARTFNKKNDIVFLDEPSNNLDKAMRIKVINFIEKYPSTLIVVTHDKEILKACNKVYEFRNGKAYLRKNQ